MKGESWPVLKWLRTHDRVATSIMWGGGTIFVAFWVVAVARVFIDDLPSAVEGSGVASTAVSALLGSWAFLLPGIAYGLARGESVVRRAQGEVVVAPSHSRLGAIVWASVFAVAGVRLLLQRDVIAAVLVPPATVLLAAAGVGTGVLLSAAWAKLNDGAHSTRRLDDDTPRLKQPSVDLD